MTAINHALTGAAIGFSVTNPILAVILAILSHFLLDAIPHFGVSNSNLAKWFTSQRFRLMLVIDFLLCLMLVIVLGLNNHSHWLLAAVCAFFAASPDLLHINQYYRANRHQTWRPNLYSRFAAKIQWFERPIGAYVELIWFISMVTVLAVIV